MLQMRPQHSDETMCLSGLHWGRSGPMPLQRSDPLLAPQYPLLASHNHGSASVSQNLFDDLIVTSLWEEQDWPPPGLEGAKEQLAPNEEQNKLLEEICEEAPFKPQPVNRACHGYECYA